MTRRIRATMMATASSLLLAVGLALGAAGGAHAAEEVKLKDVPWQQRGLFGTFDRAAVQRGFQVYQNVCQSCHSLKYLAFRNLGDLGYNEDEVKAIAAQYKVQDGPNDAGEMFERPARPSDHKPGPFKNDSEARSANNGALPPDLSLIVKAREGAENYVYSVLTGYEEPPQGVTVPDGMHYNAYFPGHMIAMPPPLSDDAVAYTDGTKATLDQEARDVVQFLSWVSEPWLEARKQTGIKVMLFLLVLIGLFLAYKRRVWADVH